MSEKPLSELLIEHRAELVRFLERQAGSVLKFESAEDLAQGLQLQLLRREDGFTDQGPVAFRSWLQESARRFVGQRRGYWQALKRQAGPMLRISFSGSRGAVDPQGNITAPSSFADRRERVRLAMRAMATLPDRDRKIVELITDGADIGEVAEALEINHDAAQRARLRAVDRFRKACRLLDGTMS